MAVSTLSRAVILKGISPRLKSGCRIFVMGFPGTGQAGFPDDLNSDKKPYDYMNRTHMNTVAGNEALVHYWSKKLGERGVLVFGLNPGLIKTNIRVNVHGGGFFGSILEGIIGLFNISPDRYAENILPLVVAPELTTHNGAFFGQGGTAILPSPPFTEPDYVEKFIVGLDSLESKAITF